MSQTTTKPKAFIARQMSITNQYRMQSGKRNIYYKIVCIFTTK